MRVIIIDDEPAALVVLSSLLSEYNDIQMVGNYTNPMDALNEIKIVKPDIVFLDIEMGEFNGLEIVDFFLQEAPLEIVFVTAYSQYAVDAFEVNAMDYLLKPVQRKRLDKTIQRLREKINKNSYNCESNNLSVEKLHIRSLGRFHVFKDENKEINWRTRKAKELFAYLWIHKNSPVNKYKIIDAVFFDKDLSRASTLLHTTIYQIRKSLDRLGFPKGIVYSDENYSLQISIESDLDRLSDILDLEAYTHRNIEDILSIYKGDVLEEEGYQWAIGIQEDIRNSVYNAMDTYSSIEIEAKRMTPILGDCLSLMYKMDPFNDNLLKKVIEYLGIQGKRSEMKKFFYDYKEKLWKEMGLKPMESAVNLYKFYAKNKLYI